jgi:threonine dehydratase
MALERPLRRSSPTLGPSSPVWRLSIWTAPGWATLGRIMTESPALTFDDIVAASRRIAGHAHRTPVLRSRTADQRVGAEVFFKCENFQRVGAFKFRGAFNALSQFDSAQRQAGVVSFSSGNHAQAIALAAQLLGISATIVMPRDAPALKVSATRGYGAEIILYDRYSEDREAIGRELAEQRGLTLIPPYDHAHVIAGQGTAALELFDEVGPLDALFVCLGGGGLLSGSAIVARSVAPACKVYGAEPATGNDGSQSFRAGRIITIATPATIADGAQNQRLGELTFPIIQRLVDDIVEVSDAELIDAMRFFAERMKMIVEPTGCLSFAAAQKRQTGSRIGVIVSGGNVDLRRFAQLLGATDPSA